MIQRFLQAIYLTIFVLLGCTMHTFAEEPFDGPPVSIALKEPFVREYYNVYKEILSKIKNKKLREDQFYANELYVSMTVVGGEIDLAEVKVTKSGLDLSKAKVSGGFRIPYDFFYYVSYESPEMADLFISKLAVYSSLFDLQACYSAVKKVKSSPKLATIIKVKYRNLARIYGTIDKEKLQSLIDAAKARYYERLRYLLY